MAKERWGIQNSILDCTKFVKHQCVERKVAVLQKVIALTGPDQDLHTLIRIPAKKGYHCFGKLAWIWALIQPIICQGTWTQGSEEGYRSNFTLWFHGFHAHIEQWMVQSSFCDRKPCAWKGDELNGFSVFISSLSFLLSIHLSIVDAADLYVYHCMYIFMYVFWLSWCIICRSVSICFYICL